jgi:hypothetical protein
MTWLEREWRELEAEFRRQHRITQRQARRYDALGLFLMFVLAIATAAAAAMTGSS